MYSLFLTLLFFTLAGLLVFWHVPRQVRLLAWGSLPLLWVSILSLAGLLQTLISLPSQISLLSLFCALFLIIFRKQRDDLEKIPFNAPTTTFWILIVFFLGEFVIAVLVHSRVPWGSWDPMFTWILRARFLVDGGDLWTLGFSNDLALLHPDYPPLFSWALVPLWSLDGSQSSLAVACLTVPFFSAWMLVLTGWWKLIDYRNSLWGYFTVAVILGTPFLIYLHASKSLDFILSYAILSSLAWHHFARREQSRIGWSICAFLVVWAALVKNEGQLWIVSFFSALLLLHFIKVIRRAPEKEKTSHLSQRSRLIAIFQGALIPLCFLIWFKFCLAPPNDLMEPQRAFEISQVIQPDVMFSPYGLLVRLDQAEQWEWHAVIWNQFWNLMFDWKTEAILLWATLTLFAVNLLLKKHPFPWIVLAIAIQLAGYYCVYLLTPYNPYWHVSTSMNRLLIHVIPAALCLLGFTVCGTAINSKETTKGVSRSQRFLQPALLSLSLLTLLFCYTQFQSNVFPWNFPSESQAKANPLDGLDFPRVSQATFVTDEFEPATVYQMQFNAVPTVLVVDRREKILLANFPSEQELKAYCKQNGWDLKKHRAGFGWAESIIPNGPLPHMDQIRKQN